MRDDEGLSAVFAAVKPVDLAARLKITPEAIYQWRRVPHQRVRAVAEASGVPLHVIRPDLYDAPGAPSAAAQERVA